MPVQGQSVGIGGRDGDLLFMHVYMRIRHVYYYYCYIAIHLVTRRYWRCPSFWRFRWTDAHKLPLPPCYPHPDVCVFASFDGPRRRLTRHKYEYCPSLVPISSWPLALVPRIDTKYLPKAHTETRCIGFDTGDNGMDSPL